MKQQQKPKYSGFYRAVLDDYLVDRRLAGRTPRTREIAEQRVAPFLGWLEEQGITALEAIRAAHLRGFLLVLEERRLSPWTVRTRYGTVRAFLRWCKREFDWTRDPTANVELPKMDYQPKPPITEEDFKRLDKDIRRAVHADAAAGDAVGAAGDGDAGVGAGGAHACGL